MVKHIIEFNNKQTFQDHAIHVAKKKLSQKSIKC